ncbi:unnamed protein product, partial [Notodromas monacha]
MNRGADKMVVEGPPTNCKPFAQLCLNITSPSSALELASVDRRNWLIHLHFVRQEHDICKRLIEEQLDETRGMCEYANFIMAVILRHEGKIQESLELFQACAVLNPSNVDNLKQAAHSLFLLGRHKAAVDIYLETLKYCAKDWEISHNIGLCKLYLGEVDEAQKFFRDALQCEKNPLTYHFLGRTYIALNDLPAAIEVFQAAVDVFPWDSNLNTTMGLLYLQSGHLGRAFERLGNALTLDSEKVQQLCRKILQGGNSARGINEFNAFESRPNGKALLAAGAIMQMHGDHDAALGKYRVAAFCTPESAPLWNNIAMAFYGKNKFVAAISCLKRAHYLNPIDWKVLWNLGLVHLTMHQYATAFNFLSAAGNLRPNRGNIFSLLGGRKGNAVTLTRLNDAENARLAYVEAVKLDEKDWLVCLNYAYFLNTVPDRDAAVEMMNLLQKRVLARISSKRASSSLDIDFEVKLGELLPQSYSYHKWPIEFLLNTVIELSSRLAQALGMDWNLEAAIRAKRTSRTTTIQTEKLIATDDTREEVEVGGTAEV